jgi:DNA repair exonuclease SbcCD ATPase subunit
VLLDNFEALVEFVMTVTHVHVSQEAFPSVVKVERPELWVVRSMVRFTGRHGW